jgi:hypothetical protein
VSREDDKTQNTSVRIVDIQAENWTWYLSSTSLESDIRCERKVTPVPTGVLVIYRMSHLRWYLPRQHGIHKSPPPVPILSQQNSHYAPPLPQPMSLRSILIPSSHLSFCHPSSHTPSGFPTKLLYTSLSSPIRATCSAHLILLDFICLMISGDEYKIWSSSLCNYLHSRVTSSRFGPNILLKTLSSNTLSLWSSLNVRD